VSNLVATALPPLTLHTAGPSGSLGAEQIQGSGYFLGRHLLTMVAGDTNRPSTQIVVGAALQLSAIWDANGGAQTPRDLEALIDATHLVVDDTLGEHTGPEDATSPSLSVIQLLGGRWLAAHVGDCRAFIVRRKRIVPLIEADDTSRDRSGANATINGSVAPRPSPITTCSVAAMHGDIVYTCTPPHRGRLQLPELLATLSARGPLRHKAQQILRRRRGTSGIFALGLCAR